VTVRAFFGFGAQFICGFPTMTKLKEVTPSKSYKVKQVNLSLYCFTENGSHIAPTSEVWSAGVGGGLGKHGQSRTGASA
jgi:hypothetical protein